MLCSRELFLELYKHPEEHALRKHSLCVSWHSQDLTARKRRDRCLSQPRTIATRSERRCGSQLCSPEAMTSPETNSSLYLLDTYFELMGLQLQKLRRIRIKSNVASNTVSGQARTEPWPA